MEESREAKLMRSLVEIQEHRDAWRRYAYQGGEKPDDFLDGNAPDRPPTYLERVDAVEGVVREQIRIGMGIRDRNQVILNTYEHVRDLLAGARADARAPRHAQEPEPARSVATDGGVGVAFLERLEREAAVVRTHQVGRHCTRGDGHRHADGEVKCRWCERCGQWILDMPNALWGRCPGGPPEIEERSSFGFGELRGGGVVREEEAALRVMARTSDENFRVLQGRIATLEQRVNDLAVKAGRWVEIRDTVDQVGGLVQRYGERLDEQAGHANETRRRLDFLEQRMNDLVLLPRNKD